MFRLIILSNQPPTRKKDLPKLSCNYVKFANVFVDVVLVAFEQKGLEEMEILSKELQIAPPKTISEYLEDNRTFDGIFVLKENLKKETDSVKTILVESLSLARLGAD